MNTCFFLKKNIIFSLIVSLLVYFLAATTLAKRATPPAVSPIVKNGIEYSAPTDRMGFVVARWAKSRREIWSRQIYVVQYSPGIEHDVQDYSITGLRLEKDELTITTENGAIYRLNIQTLKQITIKGSSVMNAPPGGG